VLPCEFPIKFIPDTDADPTEDASLLLLLSLIEVVVVEVPFGSDDDLFERDDEIFFATIAANATIAHEATTIMAIFFDDFVASIGVVTLPVLLVVTSSSDAMVELVVVSLTTILETGGIMNDGDTDIVGSAVGFLNMALGVVWGIGKLIDKLNDKLSPNKPRKLLKEKLMVFPAKMVR
jgi:hypothetical protein